MNLKDQTYAICKKIVKSEERKQINELLRQFYYIQKEDHHSKHDRSAYREFAEHKNSQLIGYIIADHKKEEIENIYPPFRWCEKLSTDEYELILSTHKFFNDLNLACINSITSQFPELSLVLNHYEKHKIEIPKHTITNQIISNHDVDQIVNSFDNYIGVIELISTYNEIRDELAGKNDEYFANIADKFENQLDKNRAILLVKENTKQFTVVKFLSLLITLRRIIFFMDELLYQSLLHNNLRIINEKNLIQIKNTSKTNYQLIIEIVAQPSRKFVDFGLGLVIFITEDQLMIPGELFNIIQSKFSFSQELGKEIELKMVYLDEHLNPYSELIKKFL